MDNQEYWNSHLDNLIEREEAYKEFLRERLWCVSPQQEED